jgi:hypothetical protein
MTFETDGAFSAETRAHPASRETDAPSAPASLPLAAIHEDPGVAARALTLLAGPAPVRKVFGREDGKWREDKDRTRRNLGSQWHAPQVLLPRDIQEASDLLRQLVEDSRAAPLFPIPGAPSRETIPKIAQGGARVRRKAGNFVDVPKHLVWLDGDGLPLPGHLIEDAQDHPDFPAVVAVWQDIVEWIAREALPECFHGITILAYPTAKHGLMARDRAFIRLCFWSARPVSSAQCKALVAWINAECLRSVAEWREYAAANPSWQPFDDSIYSPEHIILTAAPELIDRDRGGVAVSLPYRRRFIDLIGDADEVVLPEAALARVAGVALSLSRGGVAKRKAGGACAHRARPAKANAAELLGTLGPGNYHEPILRAAGKLAMKTPAHRTEEALARLSAHLVKRIEETSEPAERERRIREHADPCKLRQMWDGTVKGAKYNYPIIAPLDPPTETGVAEARAQLKREFAEHVARERVFKAWPADAMIQPPPPHTLMLVSAGAGKSTAWLDIIAGLDIENTRADYFVPDHALAEERFERIREAVPHAQRALVRHHKGRTRPGMCEEPEFKKLANELEALGVSPFENVCPRCPAHGNCAWVAQHGDNGPGIVVKQHAHMTTAYHGVKVGSEKAPARFVVDESPLTTTFLSLWGGQGRRAGGQ